MAGKIVLYLFALTMLVAGIGYIFYLEEYQYTRPTPIPENYQEVNIGDSVSINELAGFKDKGLFIHFFNNDCPCSRFNIDEFKQMVLKYNKEIRFVAVIQGENQEEDEIKTFKEKYDLGIPTLYDEGGKLAYQLGIISTPQAVIIDKTQKVYYKGNYNRARFCTAKNTQFADMALKSFLDHKPPPRLSLLASVPYGCALPGNEDVSKNFITEMFKQ